MRFLYGDSSESPIDIDYLSFVRGGIDFAVEVLLIGDKLADLLDRREHAAASAKRESESLESLGDRVRSALGPEAREPGPASLSACADAIAEAADRVVARFVESSESRVRGELAAIDREIGGQRGAAAAALDKLLLSHPLPGVRSRLQLSAEGERYAARLSQSSDLGIIWTTELEIPPSHLMASTLRVERALEKLGLPRLVLRTPGEGGVFRKRVKWAPQRLSKECIAGLSRGDDSTKIQLREGPALDQPGLDIAIQGAASRVLVKPVGRSDGAAESFEPEPDDAERLVEFSRALASSADELRRHQSAVIESRFEGARYDACERPTDLVRRMLGAMAPVVDEIAKRSPGEQELVLKRLVGDDRREEVFVSFDELRHKLDRLSEPLQREFSMFPFYDDPDVEVADEDEVTALREGSPPLPAPGRGAAAPGGKR